MLIFVPTRLLTVSSPAVLQRRGLFFPPNPVCHLIPLYCLLFVLVPLGPLFGLFRVELSSQCILQPRFSCRGAFF
jgi:hypothetical protein